MNDKTMPLFVVGPHSRYSQFRIAIYQENDLTNSLKL